MSEKNNQKLKARGYIRLSEEDKSNPSDSPENQKKFILAFCIQEGYDFQKFYEDIDVKGWWDLKKRKGLKEAYEEAKDYDVLIIKNWSRFARKGSIQDDLIEKFSSEEVKIIPALDVKDKKGRQVQGMVNEWYIDELRNGAYNNLNLKIKENSIISRPPFGYYLRKVREGDRIIVKPKKFLIKEKEAEIVKKIFEMKLQGKTLEEISYQFNFSQIRISRILKNVTYAGYHTFTRRKEPENWNIILNPITIYFKGKHEPIISKETFLKLNPDFKFPEEEIKDLGVEPKR